MLGLLNTAETAKRRQYVLSRCLLFRGMLLPDTQGPAFISLLFLQIVWPDSSLSGPFYEPTFPSNEILPFVSLLFLIVRPGNSRCTSLLFPSIPRTPCDCA